MASVVIVVVEVRLVVGSREMGYRGPLADAHPGRSGSIVWAPAQSRGLGRLVAMVERICGIKVVDFGNRYPPVATTRKTNGILNMPMPSRAGNAEGRQAARGPQHKREN